MKKKILFLFMSILALGTVTSCSKEDDGADDDDGSGITGKWYYYQQGMLMGSEEYLMDAVEGCGDDYNYIELMSNGTLKEVWYYNLGNGCTSETDTSGIWSKNGNNFTISYDGEVYMQGEIKILDDTTLKVQYSEAETTYIAVFKRTLNGDGGTSAFTGQWDGTFSGDDNGIFSVNINSNGQISGSGYSTNWGESFSLTGSVNSDGSFNAGNASTGATFTGTIMGNNLTGNWNNPATSESGTFAGSKQ